MGRTLGKSVAAGEGATAGVWGLGPAMMVPLVGEAVVEGWRQGIVVGRLLEDGGGPAMAEGAGHDKAVAVAEVAVMAAGWVATRGAGGGSGFVSRAGGSEAWCGRKKRGEE